MPNVSSVFAAFKNVIIRIFVSFMATLSCITLLIPMDCVTQLVIYWSVLSCLWQFKVYFPTYENLELYCSVWQYWLVLSRFLHCSACVYKSWFVLYCLDNRGLNYTAGANPGWYWTACAKQGLYCPVCAILAFTAYFVQRWTIWPSFRRLWIVLPCFWLSADVTSRLVQS